MSLLTVIGTQWGDEGKGKIVDLLAEKADCIVRFQGGNNAGHTLVIGEKVYKLNLLPSGIVRDNTQSFIGNGVVVDPFALMNEIDAVEKQGLSVTPEKLVLSYNAHLILPVHKELDHLMEEARGAKNLGTTRKGIGPAYEDKVARRGIRVADLLNTETLKIKIDDLLAVHTHSITRLGGQALSTESIFNDLMTVKGRLLSYAGDVGPQLHKAYKDDKNILFEGAQGSLLDIDHGTYPFVTSSNTSAGQTGTGSGFGLARKAHIIGLAKAYTTRVGTGPFPTEQDNDIGEFLGTRGHEFGTVTGRKRRCGWFDVPLVRHACDVSDVDSIALTKLDVLDGLNEIKICTSYRLNGETLNALPANIDVWDHIEPVYETLSGWSDNTAGIQDMNDLPSACKTYVETLERLIERPISIISTSPERNDTIMRQEFFKS
jgi:adenylosuccinate synthase